MGRFAFVISSFNWMNPPFTTTVFHGRDETFCLKINLDSSAILVFVGSFTLKDPRNIHGKDLLIDGKVPKIGQKLINPNLANIFEVNPLSLPVYETM